MKVRIIHMTARCGKEKVFFTEDFDVDASDFLTPSYTITGDALVEIFPGLPNMFPMEHELTVTD